MAELGWMALLLVAVVLLLCVMCVTVKKMMCDLSDFMNDVGKIVGATVTMVTQIGATQAVK